MEPTGLAPDGSPVALYLAVSGRDEATIVHDAIPAGAAILELGCGVGRMTRELVAMGHAVTGVDNSTEMLAHVTDAETVLADVTTLDLSPRRWPVVLTASHLVNDAHGEEFLAAAARHTDAGGCVLVQRHEPGWVDTVEPNLRERDGVRMTLRDIERPAVGIIRATMVYELERQRFDQGFTAHDVDDARLAIMASAVGLSIETVLDDRATWVRLRR